ncbi:multicopper oxidase family protein [Rhodopseudomonas sp. RCAM05734]|uniref:multicopper oxidase family protein n=1 Tax=Rhodopseudomonas sp. RCAM05734 TaxID=3457549 RepID=UPI0040441933
MTDRFPVSRRTLLAGLGGAILAPIAPVAAVGQTRPALALQARAGTMVLRPGAETPAWLLQTATRDGALRFKRGDEIDVTLENRLPVPVVLNWHGIDGAPAAEPLLGRPPLAAGGTDAFRLPLRHAGTFMVDLRLLGDGQAKPSPARALVVLETAPPVANRDEVLLIEEARLRPDNIAVAPGSDPTDTTAVFTVNGKPSFEPTVRLHERLRLRIINGCQRTAIALRIEDSNVQVMAIDGQPVEPFPARNGQLVLAPGTRIDAFVDVTRPPGSAAAILLHDGKEVRPIGRLLTSSEPPVRDRPLPAAAALPSNGLPAQLDLKNAVRVDVPLGSPAAPVPDWLSSSGLGVATPPAFKVKAGRTVVLALTNRGTIPVVFRLHGQHGRLLDRLDDGWKPFWLDTILVEAGRTQRIAFLAETAGRWLLEATALDWAAPQPVRWYAVE